MKKKVDSVCGLCGINFQTFISRVNLGRGKYCSKLCYYKSIVGRNLSAEHRIKIGNGLKGHRNALGLKHSVETKRKMSVAHKGEKSYLWKGGKTILVMRLRGSYEYRLWRTNVYERDNYTCQECGERGGRLEADHIKPVSKFPELIFELTNGRTLCRDCHFKTITYGRPKKLSYV